MKFILRIVFHLIALLSFALCLGVVFLWSNADGGTQRISADDFRVKFEANEKGIGLTGDHGGYNPFQSWEYDVGSPNYWSHWLRVFKEPVEEDVVSALGFSCLIQPGNMKFFARYISLVVVFGILPLLWILLTVRRFSRRNNKQEPESKETA